MSDCNFLNEEFLMRLLAVPSPSGFEQPVQSVWKEMVRFYLKDANKAIYRVYGDVHGNAIAELNLTSPHGFHYGKRIMLSGHCDEIGVMVSYIDEQGYIYFSKIGGIDEAILPARLVCIHTAFGPVFGAIGKKPVHLLTDEDGGKRVNISALWIDIGADNKERARELVNIGDPITLEVSPLKIFSRGNQKGDLIVGRGLDDKIGSFVVAETLKLVCQKSAHEKYSSIIYGVSSVQEELGFRGAKTAAFDIEPDVGIAVEVDHATDYPGMEKNKKQISEIFLGKGPVIGRGANINPVVFKILCEAANAKAIPFQVAAKPKATGTDANSIQVSKRGVATGLVSIPCRYMHTPCEIISLRDVKYAVELLAEFIICVKPDTDFRP